MAKKPVQISRIIYPATAEGWRDLIVGINAKDVADGPTSVVKKYTTENAVTLSALVTEANDAVTHDKNFRQAQLDGKEGIGTRRALANTPFKDMKSAGQFLKKLYKNNVTKVGEWALPLGSTGRFNYPTDFAGLKDIWDPFYAKHASFPVGTSPLTAWATENKIDLAQHNTDVTNSATSQTTATTKKALSETESQLRDTDLTDIEKAARGLCQYLKNQFESNPKKLGAYTIRVDDSPRGIKRVKGKITIATAQKQVNGAFIGGLFINTGITPLQLSPGTKISTSPTIVNAGSQIVITKGFSNFIVVNPSSAANGEYFVDCNR